MDAAANNGRLSQPSLTNFFAFPGKELPTIIAPMRSSQQGDWGNHREQGKIVSIKPENELDYVTKYVEEEERKINKIKSANSGQANRSGNKSSSYHNHRTDDYGERGGGRGRGRGWNREEGHVRRKPQYRQNAEPSIFGTIPDKRTADVDVFIKYDFEKKMFDTSELVINKVRAKILTNLMNYQIMMIEGFTGCGKTTQVPQFILDDAVARRGSCRIVVTQPRRIAAISVANRVGAERNWKIGGLVGYQVGMDKRVTEDTRLTYVTTGVLLQLLIARKSLSEFTHIIIDEVHERDLDTDLLLLVIKKLMVDTANSSTKIILMSATLNAEKFGGYFPSWSEGHSDICVKVDLPNQHPVTEYFLDEAAPMAGYDNFCMDGMEEPKINNECFEISTKIIESMDALELSKHKNLKLSQINRGAVLIFLPGLLEIETYYKVLNDLNSNKTKSDNERDDLDHMGWLVFPLHSSITNDEQQRVFVPAKTGYRKIILATNIAESSITVPDIKFVIDFCLTKSLSCDPTTNYTCLRLEWASKNQCIQRRGRCGRVAAGVVYRMVTRKFYDMLEQEAKPEMLRSSLESVVLQTKLLDMGSPVSILALAVDPPAKSLIERAVSNLKEIGALTINVGRSYDIYDGDLTFVGRVLSRLPIDIRLGRLILLGHAFDCLEETVIIAAGLSVKTPFAYPYSKRLEAYLSKMTWASNSFSDCIALLNLYFNWYRRHQSRDFHGFADEKAWARSYFVQLTSLREMKVLIDELYRRLKMCGINAFPSSKSGEQQLMIIKIVMAGAFYPNYFSRTRPNPRDYQKEISKEVAGNDPFSSVAFQGFPLEQPGELYKKVIGGIVAYQNCIPNIEFHGSKVVVSFDARGDKNGPICSAVYRAIKLRQLRHTVTFPTPNREDAYKILSDRKNKQDVAGILESPRQVLMPSLQIQKIQAIVTHIDSPTEFFIIKKSDEHVARKISEALYEARLSLQILPLNTCEPGQLCVISLKGKYFRGRVESERLNRDELLVYLIDRGMTTWIRRQFVYSVNRKFCDGGYHETPALAIQCRLKGIRAAMRHACIWCPESLHLFENYCSQRDNQICVEIYSVVNCVISGLVKNSDESNTKSINDILVERKYADRSAESSSSEDNNRCRQTVQSDAQGEAGLALMTLEDRQNNRRVPIRLLDPPDFIKEPEQVASLRGPHSPLEMIFSSLCRSAHLKQVMTDGSSINSVVLDQEPSNASARLLIAANVAIAARSGNIMARETTVMPPIPGLIGLLAILFCPTMELRVDEAYTTYTGCVTGLGVDPINGNSVYPDHDMEIVFDTVIDNQDILVVNSIRSSMNALLTDTASNREIRNLRERVRKEALQLLERERGSMEEIWPVETHQWGVINKDRVDRSCQMRDDGAVFPLHPYVVLEEKPIGSEPINRNVYFMLSDVAPQG